MTDDEKFAAALEASKGFFAAAGYTFGDDGKMTAAPAGAKLSYEVMIGAAGTGDHPSFAILTDAKAALATIGFDLEINDITDSNIMWDANNAGTSELWCAAWQATLDPDMVQIYHSTKGSSNHYRIADETLDADIMDARSTADQAYRKSVYKQCGITYQEVCSDPFCQSMVHGTSVKVRFYDPETVFNLIPFL